MESFDTNTIILVPEFLTIRHFLSSSWNLTISSLFFNKKKLKMSKMNFNTKVKFCKIQGTGYLIAKIHEGLK